MARTATLPAPRPAAGLRIGAVARRSFVDPAAAHRSAGLWGDTASLATRAAEALLRPTAPARMPLEEATR